MRETWVSYSQGNMFEGVELDSLEGMDILGGLGGKVLTKVLAERAKKQ